MGDCDVAVIGGGLVGGAVAFGLARLGRRVALLDEGDLAYRAARGNFALIWAQSKGLGLPEYGAWTARSAAAWPAFAAALHEVSGIDPGLHQPGGFHLLLGEGEYLRRGELLARLHNQPGMPEGGYRMVGREELAKLLPDIGPDVVGASYGPRDGQCNSLRLFRALHLALGRLGGAYLPAHGVQALRFRGGSFEIEASGRTIGAGQVVLAAGLGNAKLAPLVGLEAPVRPQRGQIVVTRRTARFLDHPTTTIRQTDEGGVMLGDSVEEAGFDNAVTLGPISAIARRAVRIFPRLGALPIARSWAALRVMSPDGFPIYQQSATCPGAFLATCHSGVTLAAAHALHLAPAIAAGRLPPELAVFGAERFHVSAAA